MKYGFSSNNFFVCSNIEYCCDWTLGCGPDYMLRWALVTRIATTFGLLGASLEGDFVPHNSSLSFTTVGAVKPIIIPERECVGLIIPGCDYEFSREDWHHIVNSEFKCITWNFWISSTLKTKQVITWSNLRIILCSNSTANLFIWHNDYIWSWLVLSDGIYILCIYQFKIVFESIVRWTFQ